MYFGINWHDIYTYVGIAGVILLMIGIWRTSTGKWTNKSILYELDTVVGAVLISSYQIHNHSYIALPTSLLLAFVSFKGLTSYAERYEAKQKRKQALRKRS